MEFKDIEYAALKNVAELMYLAARTAPKASGKDFLEIKLLEKNEIESLCQEMIKYGKENNEKGINRGCETRSPLWKSHVGRVERKRGHLGSRKYQKYTHYWDS